MQEKLIIFLHSNDLTHPSWLIASPDSTQPQSLTQGSLDELATASKNKEVIVIVPAQDVLLTSAKLPKMNKTRLAQALPYALEEQVIGDLDTMHFAHGDLQPDGHLPVAIVAHVKMQQWLAAIHAWQFKPDVILSASFGLPLDDNTWHVVVHEMAIVRMDTFQGFACDIHNLPEFLKLSLATHAKTPQLIHIHNYTKTRAAFNIDANVPIKEDFLAEERVHADFVQNIFRFPTLNLMQVTYAVKKAKLPQIRKIWQVIMYVSISWVVLLFLYPAISFVILKQRLNAIDTQINTIYHTNFPQASSVVAPKIRMQEKLQKLSGTLNENKFLLLIGYVGKGIANVPSIKLKRLDYLNNQLTLELIAGSSEDFSSFTDFLTEQGLNVKQQNANLAGDRINATLVIE